MHGEGGDFLKQRRSDRPVHTPAWALVLCLLVEWDVGRAGPSEQLALSAFVLQDHQVA